MGRRDCLHSLWACGMAGPDAPDVVLAGMSREVASIRASMDQFLGGIRPTEEAQVQQARLVQRVQTSLERLASHGQVAHRVLPPNVLHLLLEKGDRPAAGSDAAASAQLYETFGTGLDADDLQVAESSQAALSQHASWRRVPAEMRAAWQAVGAARAKTFPAACKPPRARKREVGDAAAANKRKRSTIIPDALLLPDSQADVHATVDGRVDKMLKLQQAAKKGSPAASIMCKDKLAQRDQQVLVAGPTDGIVVAQHSKEGQPVKAGDRLLTISVSGLSQYLRILSKIPSIRATFERRSAPQEPAVPKSTETTPLRFTIVVALQGVLTRHACIDAHMHTYIHVFLCARVEGQREGRREGGREGGKEGGSGGGERA